MNSLDSFSPLYKALKLFGILPFEINPKSGDVSVKWRSVLWMILWALPVTCLIILNITEGAREPSEKSKIVLAGWHWLVIFQLFASFFIQFWSLFSRKNIEKFFRIIAEFDDFASLMSISVNFAVIKYHMWNLIIGAALILFSIIAFAVYGLKLSYDMMQCLSYFYITMVYVLTNYQFIFAAFNIKLRFELLSRCLMSHFAQKAISCTEILCISQPPHCFTDSMRVKLIRKIAIMHDKLNDAVEMINSSFACELLPGMVYILFTTVFTFTIIFRTLYNPLILEDITLSILNFIWTWFNAVFMLSSISFAASATRAGNNCCTAISRAINNLYDETLLDQLAVLSQQTRHRRTKFSCQLLTIDWTLLFSMISASCTYLFIILQFETSRTVIGNSGK